ncbi:MAG: hypothetical protein ACOCX3_01235 [Chloroflexota bacterium]
MTDISVPIDDHSIAMRIRPERLAWSVVLLMFAIFCMICVVSTLGLHFFLFESSLPMSTTLYVGRGTLSVEVQGNAEPETNQRLIGSETTIRTDRTDSWSQAVIDIRDGGGQSDNAILRAIVMSDTTVTVDRATRPRFDWSTTLYEVRLSNLSGEIDLTVGPELSQDIRIVVVASNGAEIRISNSGRYVIESSETQTRVTNRRGEIVLISPDGLSASSIPPNQQAIYTAGDPVIQRLPTLTDLLRNSQLDVRPGADVDPGEQPIENTPPIAWTCTNQPTTNLPLGRYYEATGPEGREGLRLVRGEGADSNGRTLCEQTFGEDGLDVTGYDFLQLQATFFIASQSLNGCGEKGSECPIMLSIDYKVDAQQPDDENIQWIHGVYTRPLEPHQDSWLRQCSTCLQPHVLIYDNTWYLYDTGNLFEVIPDDRRPAVITRVRIFAEGHQYDVYVDEVGLYGRPIDQPSVAWPRMTDIAETHDS